MRVKLLINERREQIRPYWTAAPHVAGDIRIVGTDIRSFLASAELDAVVMLGMFAHERYGGVPKMWESQVLSTRRNPGGVPPWVVTTPPLPGTIVGHDARGDAIIAQAHNLSLTDESYVVFRKVFERVAAFNADAERPRIQTLGIDAMFINIPRDRPYEEIEALLRAYDETMHL